MPNCISKVRAQELIAKMDGHYSFVPEDYRDLRAALVDLIQCRAHIVRLTEKYVTTRTTLPS